MKKKEVGDMPVDTKVKAMTTMERGLMIGLVVNLIFVSVLAYFVFTSSNGVDGADGAIGATGPAGEPNAEASNLTYTGNSGENKLTIPDNQATAFKITDGTQDYMTITSTTGSDAVVINQKVTANSGLIVTPARSTEITADTTLTAKESGGTFLVNPSGASTTITLPAAAQGLTFSFLYVGISKTVNVVCAADDMHLYGIVETVAGVIGSEPTVLSGVSTVTFNTTASAGDMIELRGLDSTHWYVRGISSVAGLETGGG